MPEEDERPQHEVIRFKTPTITSLKPFQHAKGRRRSQTTQGGGSPTGRRSPGKTRAPNPQSPERWSRAPSSGWRPVSEEDGYEVRVRVDEIGQYIFDKEESEEFKSALQKLLDLWDASAGSDAACVAIASSRTALDLLLKLILPKERQRNGLVREAACNILVNVSSVREGCEALTANERFVPSLIGLADLLQQPAAKPGASRDPHMLGAGSAALKALGNIVATSPVKGVDAILACKGISSAAMAVTLSHDCPEARQHAAHLLGAVAASCPPGEEEVLRLNAHRMLLMLLLPEGVTLKEFSEYCSAPFNLEGKQVTQPPLKPTAEQAAALKALRNLTGGPSGRARLVRDLGVRWTKVLASFVNSDSQAGCEDACAVVCNLAQSHAGQRLVMECPGAISRLANVLHVSIFCGLGWGGAAYAAGALGNIGLTGDGSLALLENAVHVPLVGLLQSVDDRVQEAAAQALVNIGTHSDGREALNDETACLPAAFSLIRECGSVSPRLKICCAALVRQLTACDSCSRFVSTEGSVEGLFELLADAGVPCKSPPESLPTVRPDDAVRTCRLVGGGAGEGTWRRHLVGIVRNVTALQPEGVWRVLAVGARARGGSTEEKGAEGGEKGGGGGLEGAAKEKKEKKAANWAVRLIMDLAQCPDTSLAADAVGAVGNMACIDEGCKAVVSAGGVRVVAGALGGDNGLHDAAVFALRKLMGTAEADQIVQARRGVWEVRAREKLTMRGKKFLGSTEDAGEEESGQAGPLGWEYYSLALTGGEEYSEGMHFVDLPGRP